MSSHHILRKIGLLVTTAVLLTACAETRFVMHTAKRLGETNKSQGAYKVGKPYKVQGVEYTPEEDMAYDETGIASWYGPNFHGKYTANGEIYDQWDVSAAHKTLPMPSIVRVTNLDNGRSLVIRINDRGPYVAGRIIDLSRRAAQLLGVEQTGTAKVRVQIMPNESRVAAARAKAGGTQLAAKDTPISIKGVNSEPVASQTLSDPLEDQRNAKAPGQLYVAPQSASVVQAQLIPQLQFADAPVTQSASKIAPVGQISRVAVSPTQLYVQAGAFSDVGNAERVKKHLTTIGNVSVTPISVNGRDLFRVRVGPLSSVADADALLMEVVDAGYASARTVVEKTASN
jgi:rare lipoprotein A